MNKEEEKLIKKEDKELESLNKKKEGDVVISLEKQRVKLSKEIRIKKALKKAEIEKRKEHFFGDLVQKIVDELKLLTPPAPKTMDVKVVNPPQKLPEIQKIIGSVIARVKFPEVQKIIGEVVAKVKFPEVQKIKGNVKAEVEFPETQKVTGEVKTDIPKLNTGKIDVVPIVFFDGKRIVTPNFGGVSGDGKLFAAIQELSNLNRTQSVFYSGRIRTTVSGNAIALGASRDIKTLAVQALRDNLDMVYITAGAGLDYELQPGQPVTIVIDNLNKVKVMGSYKDDGVSFIAS